MLRHAELKRASQDSMARVVLGFDHMRTMWLVGFIGFFLHVPIEVDVCKRDIFVDLGMIFSVRFNRIQCIVCSVLDSSSLNNRKRKLG